MTSLYFLAFAFLASTSLLFLLWHCRLSQLRQQELRRLEEEQQEREAELAEARAVAALSGLTLIARGAPSSLIRALPTFSFSTAKSAAAAAAAAAAAREDEADGPDVEMGGGRPDQRPQSGQLSDTQGGSGGREGGGGAAPAATGAPGAPAAAGARAPLPVGGPSTSGTTALGDTAQPGGGAVGSAASGPPPATAAATAAAAAAVASLEECVICLCPYEEADTVKRLPCGHHYHAACVDEWLRKSASCPLCKETLWTSTPVSVLPLVDLELLALLHHQLGLRPVAGGAGARWGAATTAAAAAAAAPPRAGRRYGAPRARTRSLPAAVQMRAGAAASTVAAEPPAAAAPSPDAVPRPEEGPPDAAPRSQAAGGRSDQDGGGPGTSARV